MENLHGRIDSILSLVVKNERQILPEHDLIEDLGFSSIRMMELVAFIEDDFDLDIPLNQVYTIHTVGDLHREIEQYYNNSKKTFNV